MILVNPELINMGTTGYGLAGRRIRDEIISAFHTTYYLRTLPWGAVTRCVGWNGCVALTIPSSGQNTPAKSVLRKKHPGPRGCGGSLPEASIVIQTCHLPQTNCLQTIERHRPSSLPFPSHPAGPANRFLPENTGSGTRCGKTTRTTRRDTDFSRLSRSDPWATSWTKFMTWPTVWRRKIPRQIFWIRSPSSFGISKGYKRGCGVDKQVFGGRLSVDISPGSLMCTYCMVTHIARLCMYVCMIITYSRVWINRVRLPILLVVS